MLHDTIFFTSPPVFSLEVFAFFFLLSAKEEEERGGERRRKEEIA
jgi:hypothetical protein